MRLTEWYSRRRFGAVLEPGAAIAPTRACCCTYIRYEQSLARWKPPGPGLKALAVMRPRRRSAASWCLDFGYWESTTRGVDPVKLRDVPGWRDSDVYTDLERPVMDYAEAMTATPPEVTDEKVGGCGRTSDDEQLVELTVMVALENYRSRFNAALGLTSQGFKERCEIPAAMRTSMAGSLRPTPACCSQRRTGCWAASATPRTSSRTRGCAGRRPTTTTCATPRAYLIRIVTAAGARPAAAPRRPGGRVRRALAARAAADRRDTRRRRTPTRRRPSKWPSRCRWRCWSCWRRSRPLERAIFVLREVFGLPYAEIADALGRTESGRPADGAPGPRARRRPAGRGFDADRRRAREVTERFLAACAGGDVEALRRALAPDAVLVSDGGGKAKAALRPITGADKVARFTIGIAGQGLALCPVCASRSPRSTAAAARGVAWADGEPLMTMSLWS